MRTIQCPVWTSIEPQFHRAFEVFFETGLDEPGFAKHVRENVLREDELVETAKGVAFDLNMVGERQLSQLIRESLPGESPTLNVAKLGSALGEVHRRLRTTEVNCENCSNVLFFSHDELSTICPGCGKEIKATGEVIRVA